MSNVQVYRILNELLLQFATRDLHYFDYFGNDITNDVVQKLQEVCPDFFNLTGGITIFPPSNGGGEGLAQWANVPFLGRIPIFTSLEKAGENGEAVINQGGQVSVTIGRIVNSKFIK